MEINGDNNRVAANDYYEYNYNSPEPCPCCEQRYLTLGRKYCRHCEAEFEKEERLRKERAVEVKFAKRLLAIISSIGFISFLFILFGSGDWKSHGELSMFASFICVFFVLKKYKI